jgi:hypothetical protein
MVVDHAPKADVWTAAAASGTTTGSADSIAEGLKSGKSVDFAGYWQKHVS